MTDRPAYTDEHLARRRAKYLTGLLWHIGAFVIINVFLWMLDAAGAGGVNWSYLITFAWGFALAFHILAYMIDGRQMEAQKTRKYLEDARR